MDKGLPNVSCCRTSRFRHLCSQCFTVCGSFRHSRHVRYALSYVAYPERRRDERKKFAQSVLQANCPNIMAVWSLVAKEACSFFGLIDHNACVTIDPEEDVVTSFAV